MSTNVLPTDQFLVYVDSDVPPGQTLREWRSELERERREARARTRRRFGLLRPRLV